MGTSVFRQRRAALSEIGRYGLRGPPFRSAGAAHLRRARIVPQPRGW
jgi:hypothetical protein